MKVTTIAAILMALLPSLSLADKEAPISSERLMDESVLVVKGKVATIRKLKDETIESEHEPENPVKVELYEVELTITDMEKRSKQAQDYAKGVVKLRFKVVKDKRYKGESIQKLDKGHSYVVFGRTVQIGDDGMATIYLNSSNEVYEIQDEQSKPEGK